MLTAYSTRTQQLTVERNSASYIIQTNSNMSSSLSSSSSSRSASTSSSWPLWLGSGSLYEISMSSSGSSSSSNKRVINLQGEAFSDLVKNTPYGSMLRVELDYEIRLVHNQLHWLLLFKVKDSDACISMEVTTSTMTDIVHTVCIFMDEESIPESTLVATRKLKLADVASKADHIVQTMGRYNLFTSNCQHFCNTLLQELGLPTFTTTVGPETADGFDGLRARLLIGIALENIIVVPRRVESVVAGMVNTSLVRRA